MVAEIAQSMQIHVSTSNSFTAYTLRFTNATTHCEFIKPPHQLHHTCTMGVARPLLLGHVPSKIACLSSMCCELDAVFVYIYRCWVDIFVMQLTVCVWELMLLLAICTRVLICSTHVWALSLRFYCGFYKNIVNMPLKTSRDEPNYFWNIEVTTFMIRTRPTYDL